MLELAAIHVLVILFPTLSRNICHGSDSVESANKEIGLWFKPEELVEWTPTEQQWIYE